MPARMPNAGCVRPNEKEFDVSLKQALGDWTDVDVAQFELGRLFGVFGEDESFATDVQHVMWTDNPLGNVLVELLDALVEAEVLDYREEPDDQYRWAGRTPRTRDH